MVKTTLVTPTLSVAVTLIGTTPWTYVPFNGLVISTVGEMVSFIITDVVTNWLSTVAETIATPDLIHYLN